MAHCLLNLYLHDAMRGGALITRSCTQVKRIYGVYESVLASDKRTWLVGEEYTLADIITIPYVTIAPVAGALLAPGKLLALDQSLEHGACTAETALPAAGNVCLISCCAVQQGH